MDPSSSISKSMGKTNNNDKNNNNNNIPVVAAADPAAVFKCPRCESTNTKFCYYNNYSLSQPRHFCKACKRYWTRGGTLRNVPVGGGCRKHKKRPPPYNHGISTTTDSIQKQKQKERERDLASPTNNIIINNNNIPNPPAFLFTNNSMGLHFPFSTSGFGFGFSSSSSSSLGLMDNNFSTAIQLQGHNKYYYSSTTTTTTTTGGLMKEFIDDEGAAAAAAAAANHTFPGSLLYDHKNSNMQINYEGTAKDDGVTKILMDDDQERYNINNHMMKHDHQHVHLLHTDTSPSSSHLWNTTWYDPSSSSSNYMGSSVPSLI